MRILLVEDEAQLAHAVTEHLQAEHHVPDWVDTIEDASSAIRGVPFDLILLDLQLPDGDGLSLLRSIRANKPYTPVIVLTARDKISDRIAGLNMGADDYIIKPFDLYELSARIKTVSRRHTDTATTSVRVGEIEFDLGRHTAARNGTPVPLTATEWSLVECLLRRPRHVVSKSVLEDMLYSFGKEVQSNSIEAHISRLRSKLGKDVIVTRRGLGYSLADT